MHDIGSRYVDNAGGGTESTRDDVAAAGSAGRASGAEVTGGVVVERRMLRDGVYDAILEMLLGGQVAPVNRCRLTVWREGSGCLTPRSEKRSGS